MKCGHNMRYKRIEEKIMIQTFADKETEKVYHQKKITTKYLEYSYQKIYDDGRCTGY